MIEHYIDSNRIPLFACVGTSNHLIDSVAPLIGDRLEKLNISHLGCSKNNLHALTIPTAHKEILSKLDNSIYQVIGVDAMIGTTGRKLIFKMNPLLPGAGVNATLPPIGEMQIGINILYDENIRNWYYSKEGDFYDLQDIVPGGIEYINTLVDYFINEIETYYLDISSRKRRAMRVADLSLQGYSQRAIADILSVGRGTVFNDINVYLKRQNKKIYDAIKCLK